MVTVLVTAAGSAPAHAVLHGLRRQAQRPVRLIGIDVTARSAGLFDCDARYTVPAVGELGFLTAVATLCRRERVDVLVPIADFELECLAAAAPELHARTGTRVLTHTPAAVALARDKRASARAVAERGIAVPAVYDPGALGQAPFPLIVKPVSGAGSHGVSVVARASALEGALAVAGPGALVQEFIAGPEYTVDLVVAPDGEVVAAAPRLRCEVRGGQSYKGLTVDDEEIEAAARTCARALGLSGPANVQLIRRESDGRVYFVEANPKFAAAMGLTIAAGLNLPWLYVKLALGLPIAPDELRRAPGMWLLRRWEDRVLSAADIDAVPAWDAGE